MHPFTFSMLLGIVTVVIGAVMTGEFVEHIIPPSHEAFAWVILIFFVVLAGTNTVMAAHRRMVG